MSPGQQEVALRVLYTVNTSPQYILAKAPEKIALLSADAASGSNSFPRHGRASVKTCALAICRSSPELRPDISKDFSLYVLDPLEDLLSKGRHGQSGGVAVGMGLLSDIISPSTPDSTTVIGTMVGCGQENALEVVISLRQVSPSLVAPEGGQPFQIDETKRTRQQQRQSINVRLQKKTSSKRSKQSADQPFLSSHPLPSFNARLFGTYAPTYDSQSYDLYNAQAEESVTRRPNPTHFTRAHKLPTPYIGPPKRKYAQTGNRNNASDSDFSRDASEGPSNTSLNVSSRPGLLNDTGPPNSQESNVSLEASSPFPPSSQFPPDDPPNLSETAAMLAALSAVSSKPTNDGKAPSPQESSSPNPDLVAFLRAYLSALESQQINEATEDVSSMAQPESHFTPINSQAQASISDKENWNPPRPQQHTKDQSTGSANTSPLGLGRFNSRLSGEHQSAGLKPTGPSSSTSTTSSAATASHSQSSESSRKRKLSDFSQSNESAQIRRSASSKGSIVGEDLSGIRVNTGWGGLRLRADGSFSGGHPLKEPSTNSDPSSSRSRTAQQSSFFRSTNSSSTTAAVRKGPYVVPDWARGVPPPAAPPRPETSKEQRHNKGKKQKGLGRLGGKGNVKRAVSTSNAPAILSEPSPSVSSQEGTSTLLSPRHSPKRTSPGRLPIFAHSSPVAKASFTTFFQAFQTSPCWPAVERENLSSTPRKSASASSPGGSARHSSLFTPSPTKTSFGENFKPRTLFSADDLPPSPTPSKRRTPSASIMKAPERPATNSLSLPRNGGDNPQSSLPVASSDDVLDKNSTIPEQSVSSDSTVMNSSRIHDWSSFDLPPSSPPPPSSPTIAPIDRNDLPYSDIPSSDMSEGETPPAAFDIDSQPSPGECETQVDSQVSGSAFGCDLDFANMANLLSDPAFSEFDLMMSGQEGSPADAAIDALRNGLGQEDFTEAWNLLGNVLNPTVPDNDATLDSQVQNWLAESSSLGFDFGGPAVANSAVELPSVGQGGTDYISQIATNFEDLLGGCLV